MTAATPRIKQREGCVPAVKQVISNPFSGSLHALNRTKSIKLKLGFGSFVGSLRNQYASTLCLIWLELNAHGCSFLVVSPSFPPVHSLTKDLFLFLST